MLKIVQGSEHFRVVCQLFVCVMLTKTICLVGLSGVHSIEVTADHCQTVSHLFERPQALL